MSVGVLGLWVDGAAHIMKQDERFKSIRPSVFKPWIWREWYAISQKDNRIMPNPFWLVSQQLGYLMPWYDPVHDAKSVVFFVFFVCFSAAKRAALKVA